MDKVPSPNIGLDLLRVTEAAAITAGRWVGLGDRDGAHNDATQVMAETLAGVDIDGKIVIGEESRLSEPTPLDSGQFVGTRKGPAADVVVDPIDGTMLVVRDRPGAISLVGASPRGTMWTPPACAIYMNKIVVDREAAEALVPECLDAPAAWTLALVARVKGIAVRDLTVAILNRPRHRDLINEIRVAGARISLRSEGDAEAALEAAIKDTGADILMGIGGVSEGVIAACGVKAMGGGMLGRLEPQSAEERQAIQDAGYEPDQILTCKQLINSERIYFAATGITGSPLLPAIRYHGQYVETNSILLRSETGTIRFIQAEHLWTD